MTKNNLVYEYFDDVRKFMIEINSRENNNIMKNASSSQKTDIKDWNGTETYKEACELFTSGLPDVCERMKKITSKTNITCQQNDYGARIKKRNYYYGYAPNVPNAILGLPKSMKRNVRVPQKVKTVELFYKVSMNCRTSGKELSQSGECVLTLVNVLEKNGVRVKLNQLLFSAKSNDDNAICSILLKEWKQPLDLLKLSFPLTNPAMFRRFGFKWLETVKGLTSKNWSSGYGKSMEKDELINCLTDLGISTKNSYVITIQDCIDAKFNVDALVNNLNIKLS